MEPRELLQRVRKLIENPHQWTQGAWARDGEGHPWTAGPLERADKWCLIGAIGVISTYIPPTIRNKAVEAAITQLRLAGAKRIVDYNDSHTHSEVIDLLDRAIERA